MNKVIWITGASSGIGKALALKFAEEGWQVAASARREDLLNEMSSLNKNISSFPLDVNMKEKCKEIFEQIKNKYENVDICFFSTGTWDPKKEKDIDMEQIEKTFKVNFLELLTVSKQLKNTLKIKKVVKFQLFHLLQAIGDCQTQLLSLIHISEPTRPY